MRLQCVQTYSYLCQFSTDLTQIKCVEFVSLVGKDHIIHIKRESRFFFFHCEKYHAAYVHGSLLTSVEVSKVCAMVLWYCLRCLKLFFMKLNELCSVSFTAFQ